MHWLKIKYRSGLTSRTFSPKKNPGPWPSPEDSWVPPAVRATLLWVLPGVSGWSAGPGSLADRRRLGTAGLRGDAREALVLGITEESSSQHCVCIYILNIYIYIYLECIYIYILIDINNAYIYDSINICAIWIAHTVRKPKKGATKSVGESPPSSEETHAWWEQGDQEPRGSGHIQLQVFPGQNQPAARSTGSTAGEWHKNIYEHNWTYRALHKWWYPQVDGL